MRINNNLMAMNTHRQLSINGSNTQKSIEKLSSGYRINRAGDDAAGLSISEKMRAQIRGLSQASRNSQDGISMIQTAEGALGETQAILQRMRELAVQSANDSNVGTDREAIQNEMNQLSTEINRIGNTTEFNTQKLLNGGGVDAKITSASNGLEVPSSLSGGMGANAAAVTASSNTITITEVLADDAGQLAADGKTLTFSIGSEEIKLTLNNGLAAADSTATQVGISDATTAGNLADAIEVSLQKVFEDNEYLNNNYSLTIASDADIVIKAKDYDFSEGEAVGLDDGIDGRVALQAGITFTETNTAGAGRLATAEIDFSGQTAEDLIGTSLVIDGKKIAFYDSADGDYDGVADFSVDLSGAGTPESIVDRIVDELYNSTGGADVKGGFSAADGESYLENVDVIKDPANSSQLKLIGDNGSLDNAITLEYDAPVSVSNVVGSDNLTGENVVSASGLEDGQHSVKITYNAASAITGDVSTLANAVVGTDGVTTSTTTNFDSGTYRLTNEGTANTAQLQKLGSDGSTWTTVSGYESITISDGANSIGDLTVTVTDATDFEAAAAGTDNLEFVINKQGFSAALQESGDSATTYGPDVSVKSGDTNVTLKSNDGTGSVTIDVGDISSDLAVGASTEFTFTSKAGDVSQEIIGGTFEAKFQIGSNTGQSMTVSMSDMRSQALGITGTSASATVTASDGVEATLVATKSVSNGITDASSEFSLDVSTHEKATAAISVINDAIEKVSIQRSQLGAFQNRLEHTIKNLDTSAENLQASESRIRDVDMAKEMMEFTKNNILQQAAQSMLAQANQAPQGVLQLLR